MVHAAGAALYEDYRRERKSRLSEVYNRCKEEEKKGNEDDGADLQQQLVRTVLQSIPPKRGEKNRISKERCSFVSAFFFFSSFFFFLKHVCSTIHEGSANRLTLVIFFFYKRGKKQWLVYVFSFFFFYSNKNKQQKKTCASKTIIRFQGTS